MATRRRRRSVAFACLALDALALALFSLSLRERPEGAEGFLASAWPYLAGLLLAWLVARAWRAPRALAWTGIRVWIITAAVALVLRSIVYEPVESGYAILSAVAVGVFLLGWRGIAFVLVALFGRAREPVVDAKYRR